MPGPAVGGVLGAERFIYDVWGDTVNVASRLESAGRAGSIQVSETVVQQAGEGFSFTARGLVELHGRGRVLTYWLLGHARPAAQPRPGPWRPDDRRAEPARSAPADRSVQLGP